MDGTEVDGDDGVQAVLIDLAVTANRHGMYPRDHPQLRIVAERLAERLRALLARHGSLALAVGRDALLAGTGTDRDSPPMVRDFAHRLRLHQIGALSLFEDIGWSELDRLFTALDADPASCPAIDAAPFGPNLHVRPPGYDRVSIDDSSPEEMVGRDPELLWAELAKAALEDADGSVEGIARALDLVATDDGFRNRISGCLGRVIEALGERREHARGHPVRMRVSELLGLVRPEVLRQLTWLDGDAGARAALLRASASAVQGDALVRLIEAAADASGQGVSQTVLRLLAKISAQTEGATLAVARLADGELHAGVERLLTDWQLADPNPERYNAFLDRAAFQTEPARSHDRPELIGVDERLLRICMELDTWVEASAAAVDRLLDESQAETLLLLLGESDGDFRREFAAAALTPRTLRILTAGDGVDAGLLARASRAMGEAAIVPLLDALAESNSRNVRRVIFDTVCALGDSAADVALGSIDDDRWYVRRNMLAIMGQIGHVPPALPLLAVVGDPDFRVRVQALAIAAAHPEAESAFSAALEDTEPRVVLAALRNLPTDPSVRLVDTLHRIAERDVDQTARVLAVRALGRIHTEAALRALVHIASPGRNWIGRVRIRRDAGAVEAVRALYLNWADARDARLVIRAAARVRDPAVRAAFEAGR